jgi:hypothetical protein
MAIFLVRVLFFFKLALRVTLLSKPRSKNEEPFIFFATQITGGAKEPVVLL